MTTELKPCPFCGGEAIHHAQKTYSVGFTEEWSEPAVKCSMCHVKIARLDANEVITAWNTRTADKPPLVNWRVGLIARPDGSVERVTPDERDKEIERLREALRGLKDYCEGSGWERSNVLKAARQALGDDE